MYPPYNVFEAITKSDTVDIVPGVTDAIWVGGAGIVVVVTPNDDVINFTCVAGSILPVAAKRINSTTTTATLMVAMYRV